METIRDVNVSAIQMVFILHNKSNYGDFQETSKAMQEHYKKEINNFP